MYATQKTGVENTNQLACIFSNNLHQSFIKMLLVFGTKAGLSWKSINKTKDE